MAMNPEIIPADIVRHIVEHLDSRKDLYRCLFVNRLFHFATIPLLWRTLDMRLKPWAHAGLLHPTTILLVKPQYRGYVVEIHQDTSWTHMSCTVLQERLSALRLCTNLRSFSWTDSSTMGENDTALLAHLEVLQHLRIKELSVRLSSGVSPAVWHRLTQMRGLTAFSLSSSQCTLDGVSAWAASCAPMLTHLELSIISAADRFPAFITRLTHLRALRLDAPAPTLPALLAHLPLLTSLDIRFRHTAAATPTPAPAAAPAARLAELTVHILHAPSSALWAWLPRLAPHAGSLHTLTLHSRAGALTAPPTFARWLAATHAPRLARLLCFGVVLAPPDLARLCGALPRLRALAFVPAQELGELTVPLGSARALREVTVHTRARVCGAEACATAWMDRARGSVVRRVAVGPEVFTGSWVRELEPSGRAKLRFEISKERDSPDRWM